MNAHLLQSNKFCMKAQLLQSNEFCQRKRSYLLNQVYMQIQNRFRFFANSAKLLYVFVPTCWILFLNLTNLNKCKNIKLSKDNMTVQSSTSHAFIYSFVTLASQLWKLQGTHHCVGPVATMATNAQRAQSQEQGAWSCLSVALANKSLKLMSCIKVYVLITVYNKASI